MECCSENEELFQQSRVVTYRLCVGMDNVNIISKEAVMFPPRRAELEYNSKPFESKDEFRPPRLLYFTPRNFIPLVEEAF
jgi:hypothetical protein